MGLFNFLKITRTNSIVCRPLQGRFNQSYLSFTFCDNPDLYRAQTQQPYTYPFDIIFSATSSVADLQKIIGDKNSDPRIKVLAYNRLLASGHKPSKKELLAVIVEVGLDEGLDVLASFNNGTARYINHTGKILVWETTDDAGQTK